MSIKGEPTKHPASSASSLDELSIAVQDDHVSQVPIFPAPVPVTAAAAGDLSAHNFPDPVPTVGSSGGGSLQRLGRGGTRGGSTWTRHRPVSSGDEDDDVIEATPSAVGRGLTLTSPPWRGRAGRGGGQYGRGGLRRLSRRPIAIGQPLGSGRLPANIGRQLVFTHQSDVSPPRGRLPRPGVYSRGAPRSPTVTERSPAANIPCRPVEIVTRSPLSGEMGRRAIYRDLYRGEMEKLKITHGIHCMFHACRTRVGYLSELWMNNVLIPGESVCWSCTDIHGFLSQVLC